MRAAFPLASRVIAVVVGGYAATVGLVALFAVLFALVFGMARSEALVLASMIGFLGYAAIVIWGFAERRSLRLWVILGGGAVLSHTVATLLARLLPPMAGGG